MIQSAERVSLQANESGIDYYQIAGRPSGSGRVENSNSGGHERNENMKRNEESSSVELLVERRTNSMTSNALEVYSPCGKNIPLPISIESIRENIKVIVSPDRVYSHLQEVA